MGWSVNVPAMLTVDPVKLAGKASLEPRLARTSVAQLFALIMLFVLLMIIKVIANVDLVSLVILTTDKDVLLP